MPQAWHQMRCRACWFRFRYLAACILVLQYVWMQFERFGSQKFWLTVRPYPSWVLHRCRISKDVVTHNGSTLGACREGYSDVMCMDCAPKYFSSGNQCERCHDSTTFSTGAPIMVAAIVLILAVIGVGVWLWMHRNRHPEVRHGPSASGALKEQLRAQVPILLQLCDSVMAVSFLI